MDYSYVGINCPLVDRKLIDPEADLMCLNDLLDYYGLPAQTGDQIAEEPLQNRTTAKPRILRIGTLERMLPEQDHSQKCGPILPVEGTVLLDDGEIKSIATHALPCEDVLFQGGELTIQPLQAPRSEQWLESQAILEALWVRLLRDSLWGVVPEAIACEDLQLKTHEVLAQLLRLCFESRAGISEEQTFIVLLAGLREVWPLEILDRLDAGLDLHPHGQGLFEEVYKHAPLELRSRLPSSLSARIL